MTMVIVIMVMMLVTLTVIRFASTKQRGNLHN
jgi:hypothetical protein